jgi:hypothetical protein
MSSYLSFSLQNASSRYTLSRDTPRIGSLRRGCATLPCTYGLARYGVLRLGGLDGIMRMLSQPSTWWHPYRCASNPSESFA